MLLHSKPKIGCSILITNRWIHLSPLDVPKMMLKSVQCSMKWSLTHHYSKIHIQNNLKHLLHLSKAFYKKYKFLAKKIWVEKLIFANICKLLLLFVAMQWWFVNILKVSDFKLFAQTKKCWNGSDDGIFWGTVIVHQLDIKYMFHT